MNIRIIEIDKSKYNLKCPYVMEPVGVCVHNTANDATAANEIAYMQRNDSSTSFHYAVDDKEVIQGLPLNRNGWHAGDGNGAGNRKHIGIEICYSKSGGERFIKAEQLAAQLIAKILSERNWGIEQVKKHQDFSGKYCPHRTLDMGWNRFLSLIEVELNNLKGNTDMNRYKTLKDIPEYGKKTIEKLLDKKYITGKGDGILDISEDMLRILVINDRAGLYD